LFFPKETELFDPSHPDFNKDDKQFKPYRSRSKNGAYALAYGCTPKKLAVTLGVPEEFGKEKYDAFWEGNPGLRLFKEKVEEYWQHKGQKKYLIAIDRRRLSSRSKHSLVNLLFQSCGAIAMDYSGLYMDRWLGGIIDTDGPELIEEARAELEVLDEEISESQGAMGFVCG
jgi:hypothetical protein